MTTNETIVISGEEHTRNARILTLRTALKLECQGLKMSRGRSVYSIVKSEFGFKGSKVKVLAQLNEYVNANILSEGN